jgi:hypothetical protein
LKNAEATYQQAIQLCLANQLHRNVEAYMDDVVIKTRSYDEFITDLEETFNSCDGFDGSSTQQSASLASLKANNLGSLSVTTGSRQVQRRLTPSQPWCSKDDQGYLEAHWLHGSFELIYLPTWRKGTTLLQVSQASRQVQVDRGGKLGAARSQAPLAVGTHPNGSPTR